MNKQKDIILVGFPYTNLINNVKRPALIISNNDVNLRNDVIAVQITSTLRNDQFSFLLDENYLDYPLPTKSEIRIHKIFTIEKSLIVRKISAVNDNCFNEIIKRIITIISPSENNT